MLFKEDSLKHYNLHQKFSVTLYTIKEHRLLQNLIYDF